MCDAPCGCDKPEPESKLIKVCRRCGSQPHILFDSVHLECRTCFLESCAKKIRSTIGKTQLLKNNDHVIIAYSGGQSSRALLELLRNSIEKNTSRREQKLKPIILHIDTRFHLPYNERSLMLCSFLQETSVNYPGWPLYWIVYHNDEYTDLKLYRSDQIDLVQITNHFVNLDAKRLQKLALTGNLESECSLDRERELFEKGFRLQKKLLQLAEMLIMPDQPNAYIFIGDSATRISNNVMKSVIFGQGEKMNTLAEVTCKYPGLRVSLMRPLRDFSARELAFYLRLQGIDHPVQFEQTLPYSRISDKTESYLAALDVLHSSTYSTLTGVATRMRPKNADSS